MTDPHRPKTNRWLLTGILSLYLLLALGYGLINPLFEAPDEHWHYFTAQFIADTHTLPAVADPYDEWLSQEAAQPPLYYLLGALLIAPIDADGGREQVWLNPFAALGDASALTNINRMVHTPAENWPWQGFALAAHVLRIFSTLLGLGTLLCLYGSGRLIWPEQPEIALLATAVAAFLPQFAFLHSSVSNDTLIIFLASAALWQILRLWLTGGTNGRYLLLGGTVGLAILSKNAGALLLIYASGVVVLLWLKNKPVSPKSLVSNLMLVVVPALLMGGWLWLRNWQLYGDPMATEPFIRIAGGDRGYTLWQVLGESGGLWKSLFAVFGWFNLRPPDWVYWVWNGLAAAAIVGFLSDLLKNKAPQLKTTGRFRLNSFSDALQQGWVTAVLLAFWVVAVYAGLVVFMMQTEAAQGRLLFPAIVPLALGMAYGISRFRRTAVHLTAVALAFATSAYCLLFVVAPAYARPPIVETLPPQATALGVDLGDGLRLLGATVDTTSANPGDVVWVTVYWQTTAVPTSPPEFVLEILGRDLARVGNLHSYHGRGLYPATLWPTSAIIADRFAVRLEETAVAPVLAPVFVGLANDDARMAIGRIDIQPATWPPAAAPPLAQLGDHVLLTQARAAAQTARPGEQIHIAVQWQVLAPPGVDYTTLIHLGDAGQPPLATGDNQPLLGQYPTRVWPAGAVIDDQYTLTIPADLANGRYSLWLGMYDADLTRLPLTINSQRQPNDVYPIGEIQIGE